jgi:hypothetical protein
VTRPDDPPPLPDGPTPAREQLPLPRRQRQSHLEPQLRNPDGTGSGTPFAAFADDDPAEPSRNAADDARDRAAAFHAGVRRGRGATGPRRRGIGRLRTRPLSDPPAAG